MADDNPTSAPADTPGPAATEPDAPTAIIEATPLEKKSQNVFLRELFRPSNLIALGALALAIYVQVHTHLQMEQAALDNEQWQADFNERIESGNAEMRKVQQAGDFMMVQSDLRIDIERLRQLGVSDLTAFSQLTSTAEKYKAMLDQAESPSLSDELLLANAYGLLGKREMATGMFRSIGKRYGEEGDWFSATKSIYGAIMLSVGYPESFEPTIDQAKAARQNLDQYLRQQFEVQIFAFSLMHYMRIDQAQEARAALKSWIEIAHPSQEPAYWMIDKSLTNEQREALEDDLNALSDKIFE